MALDGNQEAARRALALHAMRRHVLLIITFVVGGVLAAAGLMQVRPPTYVSTASVLVNPVEGNAFSPTQEGDSLISLETEAEVVTSDAVTTLVLSRLPAGTPRTTLQDAVRVDIPTNTQILQISSAARTPELARQRAQAYASAYLDFRSRQAAQAAASQQAAIERQIRKARRDLRSATAAAADSTSDEEVVVERRLVRALTDELVELRASRVELQGSLAPAGRIISPAQTPSQPAGPDRRLVLAAGLAAGLLLGFMLALLREHRADKIYGAADVERLGVPVVATLRRRHRRPSDRRMAEDQVRHLRALVVAASPVPALLAVSPCARGVAEPGIAARLSISLGKSGASVVLVDAAEGHVDAAGSDPTGTLGPMPAAGLSEVLLGDRHDPRDLLVTVNPHVQVLPRGLRYEEALDRFLPEPLNAVLRPLASHADFVVLRSPSIPEAAGRAGLATVGHVLLVVVTHATTRADVESAVAATRSAGAHLLGAVVSPPAPRRTTRAGVKRRDTAVAGRVPVSQPSDVAVGGGRTSRPSPT
jgi:succinoglycan biosynthesis transport protein ExoP